MALRVVCAWCQTVLAPGPEDQVSHGICPRCATSLLRRPTACGHACRGARPKCCRCEAVAARCLLCRWDEDDR